jgi:hypothetical protein
MIARLIYPRVLVGVIICSIAVPPTLAQQTPTAGRTTRNVVADALQEASRRFRIPVTWLHAVMRAESHGDVKSVSDQGAIGLMQVMPATYEELRVKHGLGPDPFDPRDNILAGAAYLAELFGRYGSRGFLAAYNAGPRRYEQHLSGRPLPSETIDYVAGLAPQLGFSGLRNASSTAPNNALAAPIFFAALASGMLSRATIDDASSSRKAAPDPLFPAHSDDKIFATEAPSARTSNAADSVAAMQTSNLFVAHSTPGGAP